MVEKLTGRTRYRAGFRGKLVLQVQVTGRTVSPYDCTESPNPYYRWRDATVKDLSELKCPQ